MKIRSSLFFLLTGATSAQLITSGTDDATAILDTLLGPQTQSFGTPILISNGSAGIFSGGNSAFTNGSGFNDGIILSTGNIADIVGPNTLSGTGAGIGLPGNATLDNIFADTGDLSTTNDATSLTFQFRTETPADLNFNYIFASEEYNEFVGSFNDIFAFLLTPDTNPNNNQHDAGDTFNIGSIPDGSGTTTGATSGIITNGTVVSVNNINNDSNADSFVDNDVNDFTDPLDIDDAENHEFDGRTVSLTAEFENLPAGIHEVTLIIADANDDILDSAVFIEQETFFIIPETTPIPFVLGSVASVGLDASFRDLNSRLLRSRSSFTEKGRALFEKNSEFTDDIGNFYSHENTDRSFERRLRAFGSLHSFKTDVDGFSGLTTTVPDYELEFTGGTVGLEFTLTEFLKIGAGYIRNDGDTSLNSNESIDFEFDSYAFYATAYQPLTNRVHLYADLLYGQIDGEVTTQRRFGNLGSAEGKTESDGDYFEANLGLNIHSDVITHGPLFSYRSGENSIPTITETGTFTRTFDGVVHESERLRFGYQATLHNGLSLGELSLQARLAYELELEDEALTIDGVSQSLNEDAIIGGLGLIYSFETDTFIAADWEGRYSDQSDSHNFLVRVGFSF